MSLKGKLEAIIYAADEPITLGQITELLKESVVQELASQQAASVTATESNEHSATAESNTALQQGTPATTETAVPTSTAIKAAILAALAELMGDYNQSDRGIEVRQIAGGYRMGTKPEHHDLVRAFAKSLKPPVRLSLQALETLAVVAYKQPITAPEIGEIRGVDSSGVLGTLLDRKLITTSGRKAVIGRPILYKTTKEFLLRFGLKDLSELPSMEEFEKLAQDSLGADLFSASAPPQTEPEPPTASGKGQSPVENLAADVENPASS